MAVKLKKRVTELNQVLETERSKMASEKSELQAKISQLASHAKSVPVRLCKYFTDGICLSSMWFRSVYFYINCDSRHFKVKLTVCKTSWKNRKRLNTNLTKILSLRQEMPLQQNLSLPHYKKNSIESQMKKDGNFLFPIPHGDKLLCNLNLTQTTF